MLDWNFIASQIATIAFDIVYFGAIIGTIVVIILDMDTDTDVPSHRGAGVLLLLRA